MGKSTRPSQRRYEQIEARQGTPKWLAEYQPAIYATREEAPSISRPCLIYSKKLGRDLHALSSVETGFILLALYHPNLVDMHEQKVLSPLPSQHPLQCHPMTSHMNFPALRGTVAIAASLGLLHLHPTIRVPNPDNKLTRMVVPFPWVGDILLFLRGRNSLYCINWSIKLKSSQFDDPTTLGEHVRNYEASAKKLWTRNEVEHIYYSDVSIPTHRLTKEHCSKDVISNLRQIYGWHARYSPFDSQQTDCIIDHFQAGLASGLSPLAVITWLIAKFRCGREHLATVFYQAVWSRKLRIDLHTALTLDHPMFPEKSDILNDYAHWFEEA